MIYEALEQAAPENCQSQQVNNAVAVLFSFIEG
jgi:hypothetical protein